MYNDVYMKLKLYFSQWKKISPITHRNNKPYRVPTYVYVSKKYIGMSFKQYQHIIMHNYVSKKY